ncbi:hypothetical protein SDC9_156961 [bioreactor metagenome]|uniref:Uncharacterized protein n=1 Tax=bioreactor metagenome TaxID=1076179 RepID=A0A645F710_9ZZZZ
MIIHSGHHAVICLTGFVYEEIIHQIGIHIRLIQVVGRRKQTLDVVIIPRNYIIRRSFSTPVLSYILVVGLKLLRRMPIIIGEFGRF